MTALRSTYRRAVYEAPWGSAKWKLSWIVTQSVADYVEEQWDGDLLVRHRVIRLGANEVCDNPECKGTGKLGRFSPVTQLEYWCSNCEGDGVKPRDANPPWVEVEQP